MRLWKLVVLSFIIYSIFLKFTNIFEYYVVSSTISTMISILPCYLFIYFIINTIISYIFLLLLSALSSLLILLLPVNYHLFIFIHIVIAIVSTIMVFIITIIITIIIIFFTRLRSACNINVYMIKKIKPKYQRCISRNIPHRFVKQSPTLSTSLDRK